MENVYNTISYSKEAIKYNHSKSTYGRLIPKPETDRVVEEIIDEAIPIQDQIEALQTKIRLKERYNRVLKDELEESRMGASSILQDLYIETTDLRVQLVDALNSEKTAVQNALRTQREFQLAMTDKTPLFAIVWLDDKLFDLSKYLNICLHRLIDRRGALDNAEQMVLQIEKWPSPGSLPWESDAIAGFHRLENLIENMKVNLETANILHSNYHDVKHILREEKGKYSPILRNLEEQIAALKIERAVLQKMLDDAVFFRDEAHKNLLITEKEASENRKKRRRQMTKMKKAVQKVLEDNHAKTHEVVKHGYLESKPDEKMASKAQFLEVIRQKRVQMEQYQARARRLVETMRVHDLTLIPIRFRNVMDLGERLEAEQLAKEQLRDLLLRHKDQLYLISCHYRFTGLNEANAYKERVGSYDNTMKELKLHQGVLASYLNTYGEVIVQSRLTAIAILDRLDEGRRRHYIKEEFPDTLKIISPRVKRLVANVKLLEEVFVDLPESVRNYGQYVKPPVITARLRRVGTPAQSEDSDEDEFIDMKIPTRADIKLKSQRVIHQGMMKRGLAR